MSQKTIYRIFFAGILLVLLVFPGVVFAQEPTTTHVVQPGENLYRIGLQYGFTAEQLALANGIVNPSQVYAGQVLVLPLPIGGGNEAPAPAEIQPAEIVTAPPVSVGNEVPPAEIVTAQPVSVGNEVLPAEAVTDPPANVTHVVQANEGLAAIARQYGVSLTAIAQANGIANPDIIYPGQTLTIPGPTLQPPADYGQPASPVSGERYILVTLHEQKIRAYENGNLMREVSVSTGLPGTPTVTGDFYIYSKLPEQTMYGPGYYLPGVPWVMYFYQAYSIHGTYWHSNFGSPMSHGCVNLPTEDALWFFEFAQVGTLVRVEP